ncbi:hypothetical protein SAY86_016474 [Trapa natans]|uniref:Protein kinase domain-containing protein n=1 Tax=Trapa natans TaxID=22666 RepID=A0AAN7QX74_TRANT|nr:hypothetical protein SAY86_016474 [Trapa natans]
MIILDPSTPLLLAAVVVALQVIIVTSHGSATNCSQTCGGGGYTIQYPFGFSPGCPIQLNCTSNGSTTIGNFSVLNITEETVTITVKTDCYRQFGLVEGLYGPNFAPTDRNAILLKNCTKATSCPIPPIKTNTSFESLCTGKTKEKMGCYMEMAQNTPAKFVNLKRLKDLKCSYLLSGILAAASTNGDSLSLDIQRMELGWWLNGECKCHKHAQCTTVLAPNGTRGYRCRCKEGFMGDGFTNGTGCHKDPSTCNPLRYLSGHGHCGGTTRIIFLVGALVAGAAFMIGLGFVTCFFRRRHHRKRFLYTTKSRLTEVTSDCTIPIYLYKKIEKATDYFSDKHRLGNGAYGTVYAGKLQPGEWVAIKRIRHGNTDGIEQMINEIKLLSSVSHPNLVRLLGCSMEQGEQILVYEFMPNGTLCEHLLRERGDGLPWPVRLNIATETARAIAHLHSQDPPIYHRDVKSNNILLDYDFTSKVADFGLSRLGISGITHISTAPRGTPGYLDPQYHQDFHLSDKSDVYSFGVVLIEIISSLKVVDFNRHQHEVNLVSFATDRIARGLVDEIIDPSLEPHTDPWTLGSIHKVAELAFRCLAYHRDARPSMAEVAAELEQMRLSKWSPHSDEINNCRTSSEMESLVKSH